MSVELKKGQKIDLTKNNPKLKDLLIETSWQAEQGIDLDMAAFMLGENGKAGNDDNFIFYGNKKHKSNSIELIDDGKFRLNLSSVPSDINKLAFTLTIYDADERKQNFSKINNAYIKVVDESNNNEILKFNFGGKFSVETAIVVAEIYRHKGEWKFNAIGAGFSGGLAALCENFGIEVSDKASPVENSQKNNISQPAKPIRLDPPKSSQPLSLKKVELKKGQKISLVKTGKNLGEIVINLNWSQPRIEKPTGFFGRIFGSSNKGIDLDLACLYELKDGKKGVVQALGNCFGNLNNPPYIALDGDDRTGSTTSGETIRVNGNYVDKIKRILIFTFIYEGVAKWREADGVVTVKCPGSPDIIVKMDEYGSDLPNCGIALLENQGGTFVVEKIVKFYESTRYLDKDFNWGLRWVSGSKD